MLFTRPYPIVSRSIFNTRVLFYCVLLSSAIRYYSVLQVIKFEMFVFLVEETDISATMPPIDVKVCTMIPDVVSPPTVGDIFRGFQMRVKKWLREYHFWPLRHRFLPFDREYLKNHKLQRDISISSTTDCYKMSANGR